jgi:hypothetical protein
VKLVFSIVSLSQSFPNIFDCLQHVPANGVLRLLQSLTTVYFIVFFTFCNVPPLLLVRPRSSVYVKVIYKHIWGINVTMWYSVRIDISLTVPSFGTESSPSCEWGTVTALQCSLFCNSMVNALAFALEYKLRKWTVAFLVHTLFTDVNQLQSIFSVKWQSQNYYYKIWKFVMMVY